MGKEEPVLVPSNSFEVLKVRVIQREEGSSEETTKDKREILREEKAKRRVEGQKTEVEKKKDKAGRRRRRSCDRSVVKQQGNRVGNEQRIYKNE